METMVLQVAIPKDLFSMLGFSQSEAAEAIKEFSVLGLYLEHRISVGKAAELLGIQKREFIRFLARRGISYLDHSKQELQEEFRTVDEWKHTRASS